MKVEEMEKLTEGKYSASELVSIKVEPEKELFPFCLVWTPIPFLTMILPFVGHMGICDSKGVIYDFAGPYFINERHLSFGETTRYLQLVSANEATAMYAATWDDAVHEANRCFSKKFHTLCWTNCHSHCKRVLNSLKYKNFEYWNMAILAMWMFFFGTIVKPVQTFLPSVIFYSIMLIFMFLL
eukprot:maker-scaffold_14-snap-gene-4.46-mRNA-1 protein AED:0.00 eAED:0.00 QI:68/1/1/1/0/0/2/1020/182